MRIRPPVGPSAKDSIMDQEPIHQQQMHVTSDRIRPRISFLVQGRVEGDVMPVDPCVGEIEKGADKLLCILTSDQLLESEDPCRDRILGAPRGDFGTENKIFFLQPA